MMSLERVVAAPFKQAGTGPLSEQEFVVALSLHRDWFSPAQAKRVVELATMEGLLTQDDAELTPTFDPSTVSVPAGFTPDEDVLTRRSSFESILDLVIAAGIEKQEAVAEINRVQQALAINISAAAVIYASQFDIDVRGEANRALQEMRSEVG